MPTSSTGQPSFITEFRQFVQVCEVKGLCGRQFIRTKRLREWMEPRMKDLLSEAYKRRAPWDQPDIDQIWNSMNEAWLIFAILLEVEIDRGDLIDLFLQNDLVNLPLRQDELRSRLAEDAAKPYSIGKHIDSIVEHIDRRQYAFCPVRFDLRHNKRYLEPYILPIHSKKEISRKGGTAKIWEVEILEEFIGSSLQRVLERARFASDANPSGPGYRLALKTFPHENHDVCKNEISAFAALQENKGMIQYLGSFAQQKDTGIYEHNILLEFGDFDLEEYFELHVPPVLPGEIVRFWTNLFEVARAIEKVHKIATQRGERQQEYFGWHADIKPANILLVQEKLKLADPGFARFERAEKSDQKTHIGGGTLTYGAPEFRPHNRNPKPVSQSIDIWSFGCVLSIAASWVVLGVEGIKQFSRIRARATQKSSEISEHGHYENMSPVGDYFHDGKNVLQVVRSWHCHLRDSQRKSDPITSKVLDVVDSALLCADPNHRMRAPELCQKLDEMSRSARKEQHKPLDPILQEAFIAIESDASNFTTEPESSRVPAATLGKTQSSESSKASRLDYSERPVKKTTYRREALNMTYSPTQRKKVLPPIQEPSQTTSPLNTSLRSTQRQKPEPIEIQLSKVSQGSHTPGFGLRSSPTVTKRPQPQLLQQRNQPPQSDTSLHRDKHSIQDIFTAREEAEASRKNFFKRSQRGDAKLKRHFNERDIHFLVDNADSMVSLWAHVNFAITTLVMKAKGVDENGMDLSFTNGSVKLKNSNDHKKFEEKMKQNGGKPLHDIKNPTHTDMIKSLGEIMQEYIGRASICKKDGKTIRKLTVIILTDGLWEARKGDYQGVANKIIAFQKHLRDAQGDSLRDRQVTFQFVQFGYDRQATLWLKHFDDELKGPDVEDIVDTEHVSGDVYKMFLGSFEKFYDEREGGDGSISPLLHQVSSPSTSEMPTS